ncbi:uncharacterized protein EV422DRAFT_514447 [Fimicolochytrium jonesii]|uniref:uncharacterized protein n=1 Tax=Fimicolochytrium jonesii TaxID=1396493 RepID=UPI0022FDD6EB|nr:uncharacterized protein EV422DRAFT_514447 [Fimicolochytrium jonesii]KAI8825857.1 hypothetical protein EV422DRAFT_514447 [Fimicolochytrium jonesii]
MEALRIQALLLTVCAGLALLTPPPTVDAQALAYFRSEKYVFGNLPLATVTALGLENNGLMVTGKAPGNQTQNQVWISYTNASAPFFWAWTGNDTAQYSAMGVKHVSHQTNENLLFLARDTGIEVLTYWWLSPRQTPDPNHPPRVVPLNGTSGALTSLTSVDAAGGVFGSESGRLWWIPVVRPLSADPPDAGSNLTLVRQFGGTIQSLWASETTGSLYVAEWFNSSNNIHKYPMSRDPKDIPATSVPLISLNSTSYPNPPADRPVVASIAAHPVTGDIYVALQGAGGVLVYDQTGKLWGQIVTTFINVVALEMDNDGTALYIGGDDGAGQAKVDSLNLKSLGLKDKGVAALAHSGGESRVPLSSPIVVLQILSAAIYAWAL